MTWSGPPLVHSITCGNFYWTPTMICFRPLYAFSRASTTFIASPTLPLASGSLLLSTESLSVCIDRKSTRLNSSHDQISYAVFCLKKKKQVHLPIAQTTHATRLTLRHGVPIDQH